jgi:hypothetical protein
MSFIKDSFFDYRSIHIREIDVLMPQKTKKLRPSHAVKHALHANSAYIVSEIPTVRTQVITKTSQIL